MSDIAMLHFGRLAHYTIAKRLAAEIGPARLAHEIRRDTRDAERDATRRVRR
jgi:hypothetical protein